LIVGLGNPGPDYLLTRHNIGFMAVDALADGYDATAWQKKFKAEIATATCADVPFLLLKPQTFMNLSGEAVGEALRFYKMDVEQLIVFHDDIDLPAAKVKVKQGGGNGGHNGLKSIDAHCGPNYWRVRLGVGHPGDKARVVGHVLSPFGKADQAWLAPLLEGLVTRFPLLLAGKASDFMSKIAIDLAEAPSGK
jgi:PTH1 family peptidyl-tRNA hydrolase